MTPAKRLLILGLVGCFLATLVAVGITMRNAEPPEARGTILFVREASAHEPSRYVVHRADVRQRTCSRLAAVPSGDDSYPRPWPDGRHVVVQGLRAGVPTIIVDTRDGSTRTISTGLIGSLTWSRDGQALAFVDDGRARFIDVRGRPLKAFAPPPLTAWSPDGRRLAYTRTSGDGRAGTLKTVLIVAPIENLRRGRIVYVEPNPYGESPDAVWSADGKTLYFHRDGKGVALLVSTGELKPTSREFRGVTWSPSEQEGLFTATGPWGAEDVFVLHADGSKRRVTTSRLPERGVPQAGSTASGWSPDSEWIAYGRKWGLGIMRRDGSEKRMICRMPVGVMPGAAAWSYEDASADR